MFVNRMLFDLFLEVSQILTLEQFKFKFENVFSNLKKLRNHFCNAQVLLKIIVLKTTKASISSGNLERPNSSLTLQELKLICIIKHKPPHRGGRWNQITIIFYYATGSHFFLAFFHFRGVSQQHPEMAKAQQASNNSNIMKFQAK